MNSFVNSIAIVLIIVGVLFLSYTGFTYTTQEKVAEIGALKVTTETEKTIPFSPIAGGLCLAIGLGLIIFNRISRK